jgi:hypothetical protein
MSSYLPRIVDRELDTLIVGLAAIAIEGPKAVGKTATAARRAATVHRLDVPATRAVAMADPTVLLRDRPPVLLDGEQTPALAAGLTTRPLRLLEVLRWAVSARYFTRWRLLEAAGHVEQTRESQP